MKKISQYEQTGKEKHYIKVIFESTSMYFSTPGLGRNEVLCTISCEEGLAVLSSNWVVRISLGGRELLYDTLKVTYTINIV